ncbi:hypothetical protein AAFF_G00242870 [Aldrovandia affinis]|uniref:DNA helicase n=1 Tax=Aldrovandia affinis TaxID=143900 RepID=A0AAD7RDP6_9TELE|nr:hypothetical protein AAFF_G00242870 [Aldrovandia affinis]
MTEFLNSVICDVKKSNVNEGDEMKQIMQAYAKHREVSAQESVARVCSLLLKKCSRTVIFIQTDEDGLKMSLPLSRLKDMGPDEEDVWMSGLPEKTDDELKSEYHPTYEDFYNRGHGGSVKQYVDFNRKRYEGQGKEIEKALKQIEKQGLVLNAWNTFASEVEVDRLECDAQRQVIHPDEHEEQDQIPDYEVHSLYSGAMPVIDAPKLSPDFVRSMYQNLNETQASIFYTVREWCLKRVWGYNPEALFYFISGGAGCGKSHVIKCVYQESTKILRQLLRFRDQANMSQPAVLLTAFTGTAAFNISGKTLHSSGSVQCRDSHYRRDIHSL